MAYKYGYSEKSKTLNTFLTSVTLPTGDTWRYDYQPGAYSLTYPSYTIKPLNNTTVANRKLIAMHYPSGGKVTYGYTFVNQSTTLYENSGRSSSSSQGVWLSEERIASRTLSSGGSWKYTYVRGGIGQLDQTTVTGPEGTRTFKYFGLGHAIVTHTTYPVSTFGNLGWKACSLIEERTPNGNITTYDWQPRKIANGQRSRFKLGAIYDKQIWAPLLMARTVTRDGATYISKFSGHDAYGNPTTIVETGPNGSSLTTKLNYLNDASRWVIGKIKSETSQAGTRTRTFDAKGNVLSETRNGVTTSFTYDAQGNLASKTLPGNRVHTYSNYKRGIPQTEVQPEGIKLTRVVDNAGNTTSETNGEGKPTRFTYDGVGRATSKTPPTGNAEFITYTATSKTAKRGTLVETTQLDPFGRVASITVAGITTRYEHDGLGRRTFVSDPGASGVTRYSYDGQNRLKNVTYPGTTPAVTNTYDKTGKLLTSTSAGGNRAMAYDAAGNLIQQSLTLDGKTFTAKYGYNANDQLASITYPQSGRVVNYTPDVLGRPTKVSGYVTKVTYWPSGMINQITYANGTTSIYSQNARLWPATFTTAKTGGANYLNSAYTYDGSGNLATIRDTLDSSFNRTLGYDAINRLTNAAGFWGAGTLSYDGVGNLLKQTYGTTSLNYAYDAQNRLASVSGQRAGTFGYDAYGNITRSAATTYTYDGVPNLVCINCAVAASKVAYQYDAINQRSSVTKAGRKVYEMHDTDGKQLIELDGNTLTEYIYLGDKRIADRVSP